MVYYKPTLTHTSLSVLIQAYLISILSQIHEKLLYDECCINLPRIRWKNLTWRIMWLPHLIPHAILHRKYINLVQLSTPATRNGNLRVVFF